MGNLDRTHQGGQASGLFPGPTLGEAVQQAAAEGIAAARGVDHVIRFNAWDGDTLTVGINISAVGAQGDNQGLHQRRQLFQGLAGAFRQQLGFVVIHRAPVGEFQEGQQFLAVEHRQALARIENEGDAGCLELLRVGQHAVAAVGGDDAELGVLNVANGIEVGMVHGARMEGGDLVVVQVGGDEGLGGKAAGHLPHMIGGKAKLLEAVHVGGGVVADSGHDAGFAAQQLEVVGDVAGAAAELAAHVRHQEGDVEDMNLLGQDVVLELVVEHHDGVVGHGAADNGFAHV